MKVNFETLGKCKFLFLQPHDEWRETTDPNEYLILELKDIEPRESKYFFNVKGYSFKIIRESGMKDGTFATDFFLSDYDLGHFKKIKGYQTLSELIQHHFDFVL